MSKEQFAMLVKRGVLNPCAWCDRENGTVRVGDVSHGICPPHSAELMGKIESEPHDQR